jgi:uncharacterized protein
MCAARPRKPGATSEVRRMCSAICVATLLVMVGAVTAARHRATRELVSAVETEDLPKARALLLRGADPNAKARASDSWTLLMEACLARNAEMVALLLHHGARVNDRVDGRSVLMLAANQSGPAIVGQLVAAGADVNTKDWSGCTPLHNAGWVGDAATQRVLRRAGARE